MAGKPVTILDMRRFKFGSDKPDALFDAGIKAMRPGPNEADHLHVAWHCLRKGSARVELAHTAFVTQMCALGAPVAVLTDSLEEPDELERHIATTVDASVPVVNLPAGDARP